MRFVGRKDSGRFSRDGKPGGRGFGGSGFAGARNSRNGEGAEGGSERRFSRANRFNDKGEKIRSVFEDENGPAKSGSAWEFTAEAILHEDENYLIVSKPFGIPVHATLDKKRANLFDKAVLFIKNRDQTPTVPYLGIHHRLDRDTTGVILFTKRKEANPFMADCFFNRDISKRYLGIVKGSLEQDKGRMEDFLAQTKSHRGQKVVRVFKGGDKAILDYEVIEKFEDSSLVKFDLLTGRMHQIRVQCACRKAPIAGDEMYGDERFNITHRLRRQFLHASELEFFDKLSGKQIKVVAPMPEDMKKWIKKRQTSL